VPLPLNTGETLEQLAELIRPMTTAEGEMPAEEMSTGEGAPVNNLEEGGPGVNSDSGNAAPAAGGGDSGGGSSGGNRGGGADKNGNGQETIAQGKLGVKKPNSPPSKDLNGTTRRFSTNGNGKVRKKADPTLVKLAAAYLEAKKNRNGVHV
jgi:hypothetical protein